MLKDDDDWLDWYEDYQVLYGDDDKPRKKKPVKQKRKSYRKEQHNESCAAAPSASSSGLLAAILIYLQAVRKSRTKQAKPVVRQSAVEPPHYTPFKIIVIIIVIICWLAIMIAVIYGMLSAL